MEAAKESLNSGDFKAAFDSLSDAIATDGIDSVKAFVDESLATYSKAGNKAGVATMTMAKAQIFLSLYEADEALKWAKEGVTKTDYVQDKRTLEGLALKLLVDACLLKESASEAKKAATDMLAAGQKYRDNETIAGAWLSLASANLANNENGVAMEAAEKALSLYKELGHAKGTASTFCTLAKVNYAMARAKDGVSAALDAVEVWRGTPYTKDLASALDLVIQGHAMQEDPMAGLRVATKELASAKTAGNKKLEADLLEMLAQTRAMLGEPIGAMQSAGEALTIFQTLDDKMGEGNMFLLMSEMLRAKGQKAEATKMAEKAEKAFKMAGCKSMELQARESISVLLVERGQPEKAPKRADALKALSDMTKAIQKLNADEFKKAEEKVHSFAGLITDQDTFDALSPIFATQDPEIMSFLTGQGWEFKKGSGEKLFMKHYDKTTFYLNTIYGGMNFGPQFRHVNPYKVWNPYKDEKNSGMDLFITVSQLPGTDQWQEDLQYRPGIEDSFQVLGLGGFS